ncbi:MAG: holo-[acyl-carrier-protein] synthase [Asgard group archaeon]|nr:holo-[acyl-carrier-protein] synthase [Asgard group archaeon]
MENWSIGIDLVEINRFREFNLAKQRSFYNKVFNDYEINYCMKHKDPYPHFAGLFAAKEAIYKALNEFIKIQLYNVFISHNSSGKPIVKIDFKGNENITEGVLTTKVSISHTEQYAIAWAVTIKKESSSKLMDDWEKIENKIKLVIQDELAKEKHD